MTVSPTADGVFGALKPQAADAILAIIGQHRADPRPTKLDLGIGVYRDALGATPVLRAVKAAEVQLAAQQTTKTYLGPRGDIGFLERLQPIIFGTGGQANIFGLQTPGGSGALRVATDLLAAARLGSRIFLGSPTFPNHPVIMAASGLEIVDYRYFDPETQSVRFDELMGLLAAAQPGDALLLQAGCHNPTGADLSPDQWRAVADVVSARSLTPLIDLAYQGLAMGLEEDAAGMRLVVEAAADALVAYSCDKNFGLYRERVGGLFVISTSAERLRLAAANVEAIVRGHWSMPPDHGAAVVRTILESEALTRDWRAELDTMRDRLTEVRQALAAATPALRPLGSQYGLFAQLPLTPAQVARLANEYAVYMVGSGRINVAGLTPATAPVFAQAYAACRS